jgi:hypothetical protein
MMLKASPMNGAFDEDVWSGDRDDNRQFSNHSHLKGLQEYSRVGKV